MINIDGTLKIRSDISRTVNMSTLYYYLRGKWIRKGVEWGEIWLLRNI